MKLKTKKRGVLADRKESIVSHIKEVQRISSSKVNSASVRIFFKGKSFSGIVELSDAELRQISDSL